MTRDDLIITAHAAKRMAQRNIDTQTIVDVLVDGETIATYPDDRPLPSRLQLSWVSGRPLHVVSAPAGEKVIVITVYEPDPAEWTPDFRRRLS